MKNIINRYKKRSREAELLDKEGIDQRELWKNLSELETINKFLGGHLATIIGLKKLIKDKSKIYTIVDLGCGGGDTLIYVAKWALKNSYKVKLIGVDIKEDAINYAKNKSQKYPNISFQCQDFNLFVDEVEIDIFISSLFCHHIYDLELEKMVQILKNKSKIGFVVNDLHRHWFAGESIKLITSLFSNSYLVKNDARLSVNKGFSRSELQSIFSSDSNYSIKIYWIWAFRWLVVGFK